jgi:hypothetical protein
VTAVSADIFDPVTVSSYETVTTPVAGSVTQAVPGIDASRLRVVVMLLGEGVEAA